jgi:uncharacterized protein DUF3592
MSIEWEKWVIGAIVLGLAFLMWRGYLDRQTSPQWPSVTGLIVDSRVVAQNESNDGASFTRAWRIEVNYTYSASGQTYQNNRIRAMLPRFSTEAEALAIQQRFPAGAQVPVYYDPAKPTSSVLIPG